MLESISHEHHAIVLFYLNKLSFRSIIHIYVLLIDVHYKRVFDVSISIHRCLSNDSPWEQFNDKLLIIKGKSRDFRSRTDFLFFLANNARQTYTMYFNINKQKHRINRAMIRCISLSRIHINKDISSRRKKEREEREEEKKPRERNRKQCVCVCVCLCTYTTTCVCVSERIHSYGIERYPCATCKLVHKWSLCLHSRRTTTTKTKRRRNMWQEEWSSVDENKKEEEEEGIENNIR